MFWKVSSRYWLADEVHEIRQQLELNFKLGDRVGGCGVR